MKHFIIALLILATFGSCKKQQVIDTGIASPYFKGTVMQFLRTDDYNWRLTVQLIERAGLVDLFEGKVDTMPKITFLGFKSYSVERFLYDSQFKDKSNGVFATVQDIPVEMARALVLKHVIKGLHLKKEIAYRNKEYLISDINQDGGTVFTTIAGNKVRAWLEGSAYGGVADAGAVTMNLYSITVSRVIPMATPDLQPENGVVHALNYGYELGII